MEQGKWRVTTEGERLVWSCDGCGEQIEDGDGVLWCDITDVHAVEEATDHYDEEHGSVVTLDELLEYPSSARWRPLHFSCSGVDEVGPYAISVERIRSSWDVLAWTRHLLEKEWVTKHTNWRAIAGAVAEAGGSTEAN